MADATTWGMTSTSQLDRGDRNWFLVVTACALFVGMIMVAWSRLRGY